MPEWVDRLGLLLPFVGVAVTPYILSLNTFNTFDTRLDNKLDSKLGELEKRLTLKLDRLTDQLAAQDKRLTEQLAAQDKRLTDQLAAQDKRLTEQLAAQDKRLTEQLAAQDKRLTEQQKGIADVLAKLDAINERSQEASAKVSVLQDVIAGRGRRNGNPQ